MTKFIFSAVFSTLFVAELSQAQLLPQGIGSTAVTNPALSSKLSTTIGRTTPISSDECKTKCGDDKPVKKFIVDEEAIVQAVEKRAVVFLPAVKDVVSKNTVSPLPIPSTLNTKATLPIPAQRPATASFKF